MNVAEQTDLYAEYITHVREHNDANDAYSAEMTRISGERAKAIEAAIAQHMTPLIQTLNLIRVGGVIGAVGATFMFCVTTSLLSNQRSFIGTVSVGSITLISVAIGIISIIAITWTSARVSDLENRVKQARASTHE